MAIESLVLFLILLAWLVMAVGTNIYLYRMRKKRQQLIEEMTRLIAEMDSRMRELRQEQALWHQKRRQAYYRMEALKLEQELEKQELEKKDGAPKQWAAE